MSDSCPAKFNESHKISLEVPVQTNTHTLLNKYIPARFTTCPNTNSVLGRYKQVFFPNAFKVDMFKNVLRRVFGTTIKLVWTGPETKEEDYNVPTSNISAIFKPNFWTYIEFFSLLTRKSRKRNMAVTLDMEGVSYDK